MAILSQVDDLESDRHFKRLHQTATPKTDIIKALVTQSKTLKPEEVINIAVKLAPADGTEVLKHANESDIEIDLSRPGFQGDNIDDATFKAPLLRYFDRVNQAAVIELITQFLSDSSKRVVLKALKSLSRPNFRFDISIF